jgi:hypothetical protein
MTGNLVVGSDPGGTAKLRAESLRAGSGRIGSWYIIGVIGVTSNTTSIVFSGLDISPPALLHLSCVVNNPTSTSPLRYHLRVNGETDSSDWTAQSLLIDGTTVGAVREVSQSAIISVNAGKSICAGVDIAVSSGGNVLAYTGSSRYRGTNTADIVSFATAKGTSISTLSSIEIVAGATNGIGAGSVFVLEYLAP